MEAPVSIFSRDCCLYARFQDNAKRWTCSRGDLSRESLVIAYLAGKERVCRVV